MSKTSKKTESVIAASRRARGEDRKRHFAAGGSTSEWRGLHRVQINNKKEASRKACRHHKEE